MPKISELTDDTSPVGTEQFPHNDSGATERMSLDVMLSRLSALKVYAATPSGDINDLSPTNWTSRKGGSYRIHLAPTGTTLVRFLTSIDSTNAVDGEEVVIRNDSTGDYLIMVLPENTTGTAAYRIAGSDPWFLMPGDEMHLVRSATLSRWVHSTSGLKNLAAQFDIFSDFIGAPNGALTGAFDNIGVLVSGTAATVDGVAGTTAAAGGNVNTTEKPYGLARIDTGTAATGRATIGGQVGLIVPAQGRGLFLCRIMPEALSTSGERFQLRCGIHDGAAGTDVTDGVYFEYDEATSADWRTCAAGGSTRTKNTVTGFTPTAGVYHWLGIWVNAAWNRVEYFYSSNSIDWTLFATAITDGNIPTATELPGFACTINKTVGATARNAFVDLMGLRYEMGFRG